MVITEMGVFELQDNEMVLTEIGIHTPRLVFMKDICQITFMIFS